MASAWSSRASPVSYSASAKLMHWFVAAAVIALLAIGPVMKRLVPEGSLRDNLYNFHEALGSCRSLIRRLCSTAAPSPMPRRAPNSSPTRQHATRI